MGGILKRWSGENWDTGDILLLLIVLYLLVEGEDLDLVIALGIVLVMGLGSDKKEEAYGGGRPKPPLCVFSRKAVEGRAVW